MANTAYLDRASDARALYLANSGFPAARFVTERMGPVVIRDELVYRKELRLHDEFVVDLLAAGLSVDGTRFRLENNFRNASNESVATVTSDGVWFDLDARRPRPPPKDLDAVMRQTPRGPTYVELPARGH
jgi:acyl-CoA thioester hydrolase